MANDQAIEALTGQVVELGRAIVAMNTLLPTFVTEADVVDNFKQIEKEYHSSRRKNRIRITIAGVILALLLGGGASYGVTVALDRINNESFQRCTNTRQLLLQAEERALNPPGATPRTPAQQQAINRYKAYVEAPLKVPCKH